MPFFRTATGFVNIDRIADVELYEAPGGRIANHEEWAGMPPEKNGIKLTLVDGGRGPLWLEGRWARIAYNALSSVVATPSVFRRAILPDPPPEAFFTKPQESENKTK